MFFTPFTILSLATAVHAAYLPSTSTTTTTTTTTTLVERDTDFLGWVGQFPTEDCSGPVDKTYRYDYNLNNDCKKVNWPLDAIGVNFGGGHDKYTRLVLYTDFNCEKPARWIVESL
ncbi:MAG: hypothetical protein Q9217_002650, partial [Psora testacea]